MIEKTLTKNKALTFGLMAAALMTMSLLLMATEPAHAVNSFTVNNVGDAADLNTADNVCDAFSGPGNQCTLRAAIQQANATPNSGGSDLIKFAIPGSGVKTISPGSSLPHITDTVIIDGYTQPGASENTEAKGTNAVLLVELNGQKAGSSAGLNITAPNVVVRGLVVNHFSAAGISIAGGVNARNVGVEGNFIGTDPTGTEARGNLNGLFYSGTDSTIGGASPEARNLISGNRQTGIFLGPFAGKLTIVGNLIGTTGDGTSPLSNSSDGVEIGSGGIPSTPPARVVGGNTIAFNGGDGVNVTGGGTGNSILRNSIFSNGGLGIDLDNSSQTLDGPTPNDPGDTDTGSNNLQNKPVLSSAVISGGVTTIQGNLNSTPKSTFVIQFFSNPSGNEGKKFIGQKSVSTNSNGDVAFSFSPAVAVREGQTITATATGAEGTSEYSSLVLVEAKALRPSCEGESR